MNKPTHIFVKTSQVRVKPDAQMPPEGTSPAKLQEMLNPENVIDAFPLDPQNGVHGFSIQGGTLLILRGKRSAPDVAVAYAGGEWQRAWEGVIPSAATATAPAPTTQDAAKVEPFPQPAP